MPLQRPAPSSNPPITIAPTGHGAVCPRAAQQAAGPASPALQSGALRRVLCIPCWGFLHGTPCFTSYGVGWAPCRGCPTGGLLLRGRRVSLRLPGVGGGSVEGALRHSLLAPPRLGWREWRLCLEDPAFPYDTCALQNLWPRLCVNRIFGHTRSWLLAKG